MPQLPYGSAAARERREEHNSSHINHSPWERWRALEAQEYRRITREEDVEEENGVPETMGGQRRMCVEIAGSANAALIHHEQPDSSIGAHRCM